jgi:hypothetical protein
MCDPAVVRKGRLTSGGGRLAGVDVADNDDVDVRLLLTAMVVSRLSRYRGGDAALKRERRGWTHPMMAVVCYVYGK